MFMFKKSVTQLVVVVNKMMRRTLKAVMNIYNVEKKAKELMKNDSKHEKCVQNL